MAARRDRSEERVQSLQLDLARAEKRMGRHFRNAQRAPESTHRWQLYWRALKPCEDLREQLERIEAEAAGAQALAVMRKEMDLT